MSNCEIRVANLSDVDIIYDLDCGYEFDQYSKELIIASVSNPSYINLIAYIDNVAIGYVSASSIIDEGEILKIVVSKEFRRQHIGYNLMCDILARLKDRAISKVFLEVRSNNIPAKKLYEKNGFIKINERQKYYNDGADADIYRLSLNE